MKRVMTILIKGRCSRKAIVYLLMCCLVLNTSLPTVLATPTGGSPDLSDGGGVSITYRTGAYNHTTLVDVFTTRTIINWESLDTKGGAVDMRETLEFTQGSLTNSAVLNRISGPATQFNGDLVAPGMRIFMINPAGIVFGEGSTVNVTQLVASGLNMTNDAFKTYLNDPVKNKMVFAGGNGNVTCSANITADSVFLIGKKVYNSGPIQAPNGLVVMAAGDEVRLFENGSDVSVVVSGVGDGNPDIRNSGYVIADTGKIVLAAGDTFSRAITNVGILAASGGEVTMRAAKVENNGLITVSSSTDGGSVNLKGSESVTIGPDGVGGYGTIEANAGANGDGGIVTIQTNGLFQIDENSSISAAGGTLTGDGGSVTINCDDFEIPGDIYASPANKTEEPGKLTINTSSDVLIADGANAGATNTLYEDDIEVLSQGATSLIVNTQGDITVQDITDGLEPGEITGQFGDIELHATGDNSTVIFEDNTDTIRTTLGDIVIEAGIVDADVEDDVEVIGINVGNLTTGKDLTDLKPAPGRISLCTTDGGDIITGNLTIRDGWGHAEINVDSSSDLTVNGDVIVGSESPILNVPLGADAEAYVYLKADENVVVNSNVEAHALGIEAGNENSVTKAYIEVNAGQDAEINGDLLAEATASSNGTADAAIKVKAVGNVTFAAGTNTHAIADGEASETEPNSVTRAKIDIFAKNNVTINGDLFAEAKASNNGTSDAAITVEALGAIDIAEGAEAHAMADDAEVVFIAEAGDEDYSVNIEDTNPDGDHAQIIINENAILLVDDSFTTPKSVDIQIDVLANDTLGDETISSYHIDPAAGSITPTMSGDKIVGLTYHPPEDPSTLTFNASGQATVTFTYTINDKTATVTITLTNGLPVAVKDSAKTYQDQAIKINVITNDTDPDTGDVLAALLGDVAPKNGTLVLNADGTFTYTPNKGYLGKDSFNYKVTDGCNTSAAIEVKITITEEPPPPLSSLVLPYMYPTPGLDSVGRTEIEISGCPALAKWVAEELGVDERVVDIWMVNSLASTKDIQPYDAYAKLRKSAIILQDADGSHIAALAQVINELASSYAPPSEEQMAAIADAITSNTDKESYYAVADEYLDALVTYVGILSTEMGFPTARSVQIVTDKYVSRLTQDQNVGVASFVAACLAALRG
jgi:filamentous hemagglutinin family protein